ncbi:MAG TPA: hypothetical protein P5081_01345 [Phycisphaerae bacterium]|nr:hypothetical protein [Phycisphaerae bacterium]HRW51499.1 hypothetical protein [Phycisphaerae bacterium]
MTKPPLKGIYATASAGLPACPFCEYSLAGFPGCGRCPECGFEYDKRSVLHRRDVAGDVLGRALMAGLLAFVAFALGSFRQAIRASNPNWDPAMALTAIVCTLAAIVLALMAIWGVRYHIYWCTGPVELVIRPFLQKPLRIRLTDKRGFRAFPSAFPLPGGVVVERLRGRSFRLGGGLGGTDAAIRVFMDDVHLRMSDVRGRVSAPPATTSPS